MDVSGSETIDRARKLLTNIDGGLDRAVRSAMERSVSHLRTQSGRKVRERYDISQANIRANETITVSYTMRDGVQAAVTFAGTKIPLFRYGKASPKAPAWNQGEWVRAMIAGHWKTVHPGLAAAGHQFSTTGPTRFQHAFVAAMKSGHTGIFERTGASSENGGDAIEEIMGSSVPQMLGNEQVEEALSKETMEKFDERLDHEVIRLLNGW